MNSNKTRRLAAIMFTDIVGYTALMQNDEHVASNVRKRHREVFEACHKIHHGEIVQYFGDGTLSVFKSGLEAVECAISIQKKMQENDPIPLRIGLHMGDIVFDGTEVFGDGVNVASRIENLSNAGSILVSGKLNDELSNHSHISSILLGEFEFKNVNKPIEVYAISNQGIHIPDAGKLRGKQKIQTKSIAVLPFSNLSSSQDNEYFCDGMTEEIINALAKVKALKVTSRTSSFFFKNKNVPIKEIGKELSVSAILEGSVRLSGNNLRITAQLIQAEEDFHFWSETWDRKLENVFEIQDEVSLQIADKLREQFGHFEIQPSLVKKQTDNMDAYEYSLKAKYHFNKWNPEDVKVAIELYEKALALDPNHAESLIGLADAYSFMATTGHLSFEEGWGKAIELTNRADQLNIQFPGVHYQQANTAFFIQCDFKEALIQASKAIELNPSYAEAQQFISFLYILAGNKDKSLKHLNIALSLNPLSQETLFFYAYYQYMIGDYSAAMEKLDNCLSENPKNIPAQATKCYCFLKMGKFEEAIDYMDNAPKDTFVKSDVQGITGLTYVLTGKTEKAIEYLERIEKDSKTPDGFNAHSYLFCMHVAMGEFDKACEWIEEAIEIKSSLLLLRFPDPLTNALNNDPRYIEFQKKIFPSDVLKIDSKKKKALLDKKVADQYLDQLLDHMHEKTPYVDPELSLRSLANQIDIHPNQLSWLLNESIGKNFNEFVNHYRINTFKEKATDKSHQHLTLLAIAYESGFNSKTAFNTYFKKETGLTPKAFLKGLKHNSTLPS
ncbi:MAG: adenylate cyclase [Cyclobacteriaceae bacterium]|jgi:adenylate cyclase